MSSMKRILSIFFLLLITSTSLLAQVESVIPAKPSPPRLVNDLTGKFLTPDQVAGLEAKLVAYDDSTSNQIAIVVVDDLKGYSAADYAIALGRKWGVGNADFNNGVVILVSTGGGDGNRDVFIAPGYGLEGAVTDLLAAAIVDNDLVPNFKKGNQYVGLDQAVDDVIKAAAGRYTAPDGYADRGRKRKGVSPILIVFLVIIIVSLFSRGGRGGGGGMLSRRGFGPVFGPFGGMGGGFGGGGFGGGGGGGGGFGGFGGGGFGGGGAGGKW